MDALRLLKQGSGILRRSWHEVYASKVLEPIGFTCDAAIGDLDIKSALATRSDDDGTLPVVLAQIAEVAKADHLPSAES